MMTHDYFDLQELLRSDTALAKKIDNSPSWEVVAHLDELAGVLDKLRAAWGKPIRISSGYRCDKLNRAVGGAATSVHKIGYAADMQVSGSFDKFRDFVVKWLEAERIPFDQLLIERNAKTGAKWLHLGLYNNARQQRRIVKVMEVRK